MKLLKFNIIWLLIAYLSGILLQYFISFPFLSLVVLILILLGPIGYFGYSKLRKPWLNRIYHLFVIVMFITLGSLNIELRNPEHQAFHYTQQPILLDHQLVSFEVRERLKTDRYNSKYIVRLLGIGHVPSVGNLLLNIPKDSSILHVGRRYSVVGGIESISKPLNPYQFDYSNYLKNKQIYHQLFAQSPVIGMDSKFSVRAAADKLRWRIHDHLLSSGFDDSSIQLINALILGQRQDIDPTLYTNYINAGAVHILAVSGLHVGILLLILNTLLKPLLYLRYGRIWRPLIIVALLWAFAILAGLSPSVTRAVSMFSLISIAMHFKRHTNVYNTLFSSAFILLVVNPYLLFEVGFQLSYLAVLSIVSIQPLLFNIWHPKLFVIKKLWAILTVTVAAQIGVAPLSLFYFHQFPGLFFISNLVIIPFLGFILGFGLLIVILATFQNIPQFITDSFNVISHILNSFVTWVASFEGFLIRNISISLTEIFIIYAILIAAFLFLMKKSYQWLLAGLVGIILLQLHTTIAIETAVRKDSFMVFHKSRHTVIGEKQWPALRLIHNLNDSLFRSTKIITDFATGEHIQTLEQDSISKLYRFKKHLILVIDRRAVYEKIPFKPAFVLLRDSPQLNLNRLIDKLEPIGIIADGSNYKSYVSRWKTTCDQRQLYFHYTAVDGAFILSENKTIFEK